MPVTILQSATLSLLIEAAKEKMDPFDLALRWSQGTNWAMESGVLGDLEMLAETGRLDRHMEALA
nr:MAG TPA: hypothetical protein [Caudoviricetes sp.]